MEIRIAKYSEKQLILDFIDTYWQKGHIFVKWPELFDNYHKNGDLLNYVIAIDESEEKIYGVCGFIYANHREKPDVWLALWKVIPSGIPGLGLDMVRYLYQELRCNILACCGIKKEVKRLYEFLGYKTGTLYHYYRLNEDKNYTIAYIQKKTDQPNGAKGVVLEKIDSEKQFKDIMNYEEVFDVYVPYKDIKYFIKKYFHNIAYDYQVWGIRNKNNVIKAVLVTKSVAVGDSRALRIIDFVGDETELAKCGASLDDIIKKENYEYVDFYEYGLQEKTLLGLGMVLHDKKDGNIIPNYFEPFLLQNVDIHFFTNKIENFRMFKADGDQERPNCLYRKDSAL